MVDSYSCRQMYLRSYTFSKKETVKQRTRKCLGRVKERVTLQGKNREKKGAETKRNRNGRKGSNCVVIGKLREITCAFFHRLLSCTTSVDVVDV